MARVLVMIPSGEVYDHDSVRWYNYKDVQRSINHYHNIGDAFVFDSSLKLLNFSKLSALEIVNPKFDDMDRINAEYDFVFLRGSNYVNKDMRAPFMAHLDNADGSRVTIQVLPTEQTSRELTNELVVVTNHPYLKTEHEARLRWEELCRTLQQYSLNVSRSEARTAAPLLQPDSYKHALIPVPKSISFKSHHNV